MTAAIDLTQKRFGRLVALRVVSSNPRRWHCRCDCGNTTDVIAYLLTSKHTRSCKCLLSETSAKRMRKHGYAPTSKRIPEYNAWQNMKARCYRTKCDRYYHYGARGIRVCRRWKNSFENFLADMGRKPSPKHSLHRIDNNKNYTKSNCKWATAQEQQRSTSRSHFVTWKGQTKALPEWAELLQVPRSRLQSRLGLGWTIETAFTAPRHFRRVHPLCPS